MKILQSTWSSYKDATIGFILTENRFRQRKIYWGLCQEWNSEELDRKYIAKWGGHLPVSDLKQMIEKLEEKP